MAREEREAARVGPLTASALVGDYYEYRKRRLQRSTQHHYEQLIAKHIVPKIGPLSARELAEDPSSLHDFYDSLPRTTALHVHQILRPAFQFAVDHRRLDRNPCAVAKPPRAPKRRRLIPTPEEVQKIVLAAEEEDERFGLYVWIVARLGRWVCTPTTSSRRPKSLSARRRWSYSTIRTSKGYAVSATTGASAYILRGWICQ